MIGIGNEQPPIVIVQQPKKGKLQRFLDGYDSYKQKREENNRFYRQKLGFTPAGEAMPKRTTVRTTPEMIQRFGIGGKRYSTHVRKVERR